MNDAEAMMDSINSKVEGRDTNNSTQQLQQPTQATPQPEPAQQQPKEQAQPVQQEQPKEQKLADQQ